MKTSVSSYSFQRLLNSGEYTQLGLIGLARSMGFDAIEFTDLMPGKESVTDYAKRLREESEKKNLPVINYTIGADFLNCESIDKQIEDLYKQVDIAVLLGAKGMRHDATSGFKADRAIKGFDEALPILADGCRRVTRYAKSKGIATMVENHGFFCQDSLRVARLVTTVADANFGTLVDIGNFMCADEKPNISVGNVAPFAKHVHVKDFHFKDGNGDNPGEGFFKTRGGNYLRGAILGHGAVPVRQCLSILKSNGYDGYVSIEFEGMEDNIPALRIGLANLKGFIENI